MSKDFKEFLKLLNAHQKQWQIIRLGVSPVRIKIATTVSGVDFSQCYAQRVVDVLDGVKVNLISLNHLKINKKASGTWPTSKTFHRL
jgi:hypothetical protein